MRKTIFHESWWLEAVAPGEIEEFKINYKDQLAIWPFCKKTDRFGLSYYTSPKLTQTLGPYLSSSDETDLGSTKYFIEELIKKIPDGSSVNFKIPYTFKYFLPFHWAGFKFVPLTTYTLDTKKTEEEILSGISKNIIGDIKKAQKKLKVVSGLSPEEAFRIMQHSYMSKNLPIPYDQKILIDTWSASRERDRGMDFYAIDDQGKVHAVIFCVWDDFSMYYIFAATDPLFKGSGANSLLLWEAIKLAKNKNLIFDFEGSMNPHIEKFFRGFGGSPQIYLYGHKDLSKVAKLKALGAKWIS